MNGNTMEQTTLDWQKLGSAFRVTFYPLSEYNVPNVPVNERQRWFLNQLEAGENVGGADLARHWDVAEKTAKRDIADSSPSVILTQVFDDVVESLMEKILTNLHESRTLASIRDTILPKRISGELRVPDAEKLVEGAI